MDNTLSAYFLCAGFGQRLRPLTQRIPKPALSFLGQTAL
jgi:NDP-sugar pyrophosphorylase family protein